MKKLLALAALLSFTAPSLAADNTLLVTPCSAGCVTTKSKDVGGGVQAPQPILSDATGTSIYGTAGTANANVLTVQGIASMTALQVANGGTFAVQAAQSGTWNITNISGTITLPTGASTSSNQTSELTKLDTIITNTGAAIPAGTNVIGHVIADTGSTTVVTAVSAGTTRIGYVSDDPCTQLTKSSSPITQIVSTKILPQSGSNKNYICSIMVISADAENVSVVEGTGSVCGSSTAAIIGGTTAAAGVNLAANGGLTFGNGGATVAKGFTANSDMCLLQSGSGRVSGSFTYIQVP